MRNILVLAAIAIVVALIMARTAENLASDPGALSSVLTPASPMATMPRPDTALTAVPSPSAAGRSVSVPRDSHGQYWTAGHIDGQRMEFLIDTGATTVALNQTSASRFGLYPNQDDYRITISTANGTVKAAPTRISTIEVSGIVVHDVEAIVLPDEALAHNLLGVSFLNKLRRFALADGTMVLEP
ncbi:MAG: TIGR02281 family clan AA aspartic protease [Alphaproteobacteria bacterium]|nr:TIGR02281 family clan AA aspartic protease [Alphaproteobacteria bacterium]